LLIVVITEGTTSPLGGLQWCEGVETNYHEQFKEFYRDVLGFDSKSTLPKGLAKAKRKTIVQVACGVGLRPDGITALQKWMTQYVSFFMI
jgi:hypothetical protein